ncbi:alanyl-tRNA editing protein [Palaeococcus ferrophilus]|uniref:alanyl-tRNA editing protein n=1 Tax=Palaeococcus ferrophilus TaxID=83868 RepID=UPI00064F5EC3|nr:DHHA1 domain-containing protein [Palaeococcus ferrophilus]
MTVKLFYEDPYLKEESARVEKIEVNEDRVRVKLDRTIFYPEGGGQPSDRGTIYGEGFHIEVERVEGKDEVWHVGRLKGRAPEEGEEVMMELDWAWRYENMRAHTGQHILSAVLKEMYGSDTTGFQIFEDYCKIEINFEGELRWEHILGAELEANEVVWNNLPVEVEEYEYLPEELAGILRKHVPNVRSKIRIVKIPGVDATPCGGTHVRRTGEIGLIKVLNFYRKSSKLWRIEFATGYRALIALEKLLRDYWESLDEMPNKNRPLVERVRELKGEMEALEEEKKALRLELWEWKERNLIRDAEEVGGVRVVTHLESASMKDAQAFAIHLVENNPGTVAVLTGENYVLLAKNEELEGLSMREVLKEMLSKTGGGGGGSDNLAKGGGFNVPPEEVIKVAVDVLKGRIGGS